MTNSCICQTLRSIVADLGSLADLDVVTNDEADALEVRVELVYRDLLAKEACEELSDGEKEALQLVVEAYLKIRQQREYFLFWARINGMAPTTAQDRK